MAAISSCFNNVKRLTGLSLFRVKVAKSLSRSTVFNYSDDGFDRPDAGPPIPTYKKKRGETNDVKKARLLYQSRFVIHFDQHAVFR